MIDDGGKTYREAFWLGLAPDALMNLDEWADKYRMLSSRAASEPGPWRTSRTPYLKEIMRCLSPVSPIEEVIFMKGAQLGATECGINWIGFVIDVTSGPMLAVQPTVEMAKRNSKQRIDPLIEECDQLSEKVCDPRSRDSGNTVLTKEFPGGILVMTGANSAVGLRSLPARYLFLDEVDAYPGDVDGEGDPVLLAKGRTRTFARRKIYIVSTPTVENRSRIEVEFLNSDQRYYHVPCPHCGHKQILRFDRLRWPKGEPHKVSYFCEKCESEIQEHHKTQMLSAGEWIAQNPGAKRGRVAGFHLSSLYSPSGWLTWAEIAALFLECKNSPEKMRGFVNTVLGETWKAPGEAPDWKRLYDRRESYSIGVVPMGAIFITAGADIQKDRIEVEIVAWGPGKESWSIDYRVLTGETSAPDAGAWLGLDGILNENFPHLSGSSLSIRMLAVDSGYNTQAAYNWARKYPMSRVIATKGSENTAVMLGQPSPVDVNVRGQKLRRGFKVWTIGVNLIKSELYGWLGLEKPTDNASFPAGFCHFPEYAEEFFKQLASEQLVVRTIRGYQKHIWEKIRDRNEALDCRVLARVAAAAVGIDRFKSEQWEKLASTLGIGMVQKQSTEKQSSQKAPADNSAPVQSTSQPRRKSNYL